MFYSARARSSLRETRIVELVCKFVVVKSRANIHKIAATMNCRGAFRPSMTFFRKKLRNTNWLLCPPHPSFAVLCSSRSACVRTLRGNSAYSANQIVRDSRNGNTLTSFIDKLNRGRQSASRSRNGNKLCILLLPIEWSAFLTGCQKLGLSTQSVNIGSYKKTVDRPSIFLSIFRAYGIPLMVALGKRWFNPFGFWRFNKYSSGNRGVLNLSNFFLNLSKLWGVLNLSKFSLNYFWHVQILSNFFGKMSISGAF